MATYGSIPNDEYELDSRSTTRDANRLTTLKTNQDVRTYVKVPEDEGAHPQPNSGRFPALCVSRVVLLGLALFFASSALTIGLLYHFSQVNHGLTTEKNSHRYAWLYGPTAVVVLIRMIWRMIDLKVKETMPWHELANGPSPAEKTIFLDYISSSPLPDIWKSFKFRHWATTITVVGQLVLLVMLVFITGLFTLESTLVSEENVPFSRNDFNGSAFNVSRLDSSSALMSLAIQTQNLSYPRGTSLDTIVPLFAADPAYPANLTTQALSKGIKVSVDCETLDIKNASQVYLPWYSIRAPQFLVNVTTPSCNIINARIGTGPNHGDIVDETASQTYQGWMTNFVCNSGLDYSQPWGRRDEGNWMNDTTYLKSLDRTLDDRLLVTVVDFHYTPVNDTYIPTMWVHGLTALLCKPSYSINDYRVKYSKGTLDTRMELVRETDETLANFYPSDISKAAQQIFNGGDRNLFIGVGGVDYQFTTGTVQPFAQILTLLHGGDQANFTLKDLMDAKVLKESTEIILESTMIQGLYQKVMTAMSDMDATNFTGIVSYNEDRLHVKALSTGFLCIGFGLMSILVTVLIFVAPRKPTIGGSVGSILAIATVLRSNPDMDHICQEMTSKNNRKANHSLKYLTRHDPKSGMLSMDTVVSVDNLDSRSLVSSQTDDKKEALPQWWQPVGSRDWYAAMAVVLCFIIIGLLELIQRLSDSYNGFMAIASTGVGSAILSQYIPAAMVISLTLIFADIERLTATFSPFVTLKKGGAMASQTLTMDYLTRSGPHALVSSVINRHFALAIILITTFVGSFLTIVIPGLYSHHDIPFEANITLVMVDKFNYKDADISLDDKRAGVNLNLVTYYGVEYPRWVYDDLAFPQLSAAVDMNKYQDVNSSLSIISTRTNATRPNLSCESISAGMNWTSQVLTNPNSISETEWNFTSVVATAYLPWSMCSNPPSFMNESDPTPWAQWTFAINETTLSRDTYFIGSANNLEWHTDRVHFLPIVTSQHAINIPRKMNLPQWGCPSVIFALGTVTFDRELSDSNTSAVLKSVDVNIQVCSQNLQTVETDLVLEYPSMAITREYPPVPDESTVKWLQNSTNGTDSTAFQYVLANMLISLNNPDGYLSDPWSPTDDADRFNQALVHIAQQEEGLQINNLVGVENSDTYMKMVRRLYGRYMAQALSNNMRVSTSEETPDIAFTDAPWSATASPVIVPTPGPSSSTRRPNNTMTPTKQLTKTVTATTSNSDPTPSAISTTEADSLRKRVNDAEQTIPATLTRTGAGANIRLKQNDAPKIALQALLAFMAVGAIATKLLLRTNKTLQHEPYSIAGRAALVANGNMLHALERDRDGTKRGEERYCLGWWEDDDGRVRYGVCAEDEK